MATASPKPTPAPATAAYPPQTQKVASTSQVNLAGLESVQAAASVPMAPRRVHGERGKLRSFLAKLDLYIGFNQKKFNSEIDKGLYATTYLKDADLIGLTRTARVPGPDA